jgi:hypothetical protein
MVTAAVKEAGLTKAQAMAWLKSIETFKAA